MRPLVGIGAALMVVVLGGLIVGLLTQPTAPEPTLDTPSGEIISGTTAAPTTTLAAAASTTTRAPMVLPGSWIQLSNDGFQLGARGDSSAIWTGTEMIVWGGWPTETDDRGGAAYDPSAHTWRSLPQSPIEEAYGHEAVWTGREMIVWGGVTSSGFTGGGAAYDPKSDTWRTIADSPLSARSAHSAIWTGSEMIILGGYDPTPKALTTVAAYEPETDRWRAMADSPVLGGLVEFGEGQSAVWTGSHIVVYGADELAVFAEEVPGAVAAVYQPADDAWTVLSDILIHPRLWHSAVWTGTEVIVWGGSGRDEMGPAGIAYQPDTRTWRALADAPVTERARHVAFWTGTHMVIWGGSTVGPASTSERIGSGVAYEPALDAWLQTETPGLQSRTVNGVWTGESAIIWTGDPSQSGMFTSIDP